MSTTAPTVTPSEDQNRLSRYLGFLELDSTNLSLRYDALVLAIDIGDLTTILALIDQTPDPIDDIRFIVTASNVLLRQGRYAQAAEMGSKAIARGLADPFVIFNTAYAFFYVGDYAQTVDLLQQLFANPEYDYPAIAHLVYARTLYQLEDHEQAITEVLKFIAQEPQNAEALGLLALLYYDTDRNVEALETAQSALLLEPNQFDALLAYAEVKLESQHDLEAESGYQRLIGLYTTCGRAWSGLGQLAFKRQDFSEAERDLLTAVEHMPNHIGTWHLLAWIYILRKDTAQARHALEQAYTLDRNFAETHGGLAVVDVLDDQIAEANLHIKRAIKLNPEGLSARYAEVLLQEKAGHADTATALMDQILSETAPSSDQSGYALIAQWRTAHQS